MSELAKALLAFQQNAPRIQKDSINPHFRSKFPSLHGLTEAVLPELNAQGVVLMQLPTVHEGSPALRTILVHAESGDSVEDVMLLQAAKDDPQGQGSALTYARRYALMAALGLVADEDDDGNAAQNRGRATATGTDSPAVSPPEAGSTPAPDTPFKAPTGKRGGGVDVEKLRSELVDLVTQLGAADSLKTVHEHADAADAPWLKRQIKTAKEALAKKEALPFE